MKKKKAIEIIGEESTALFADGFDDCILGVASRFNMESVIAYDLDKIISKLMTQDMSEEDAIDYFNFNIIGSWVGEGTPIFVKTK